MEALEGYPLYSQDGKGNEAICRAVFAIGSIRWFILEGDQEGDDVILFGIVIGLMEDEYGYISLNELSNVELDMTKEGWGQIQSSTTMQLQTSSSKNKFKTKNYRIFFARFE